jgi:hypothetical protein
MSYVDISAGQRFCEAMKLSIAIAGGPNNQSFLRYDKVGLLQALMDPDNQPEDYQAANMGTSRRIFKVPRLPRKNADDAVDEFNCDPSDQRDYTEQEFDPADFYTTQTGFTVTESELVKFCADVSRVTTMAGSEAYEALLMSGEAMGATTGGLRHFNDVFNKIVGEMHALRSAIDKNIAIKMVSSLGINAATGNNVPVNLPVLNASDFSKREEGIQILQSHMQSFNQVNAGYFVIGRGLFDRFNTSLQYGCCNNGGLNWDAMNQFSPYKFYLDQYVTQAFALEDFLLVLPYGETKFMYYNRNLVNEAYNAEILKNNSIYGTIPDPMVPGLSYDIQIKNDDCQVNSLDMVWDVKLRLRYDVAITPPYSYNANDPLFGVNGIFGFIATTA